MKTKIFKHIILSGISLALGLSSCDSNLLETVPNDRLLEGLFWKTKRDAELAVNSIYTDLDSTNLISWDGMTDIAHINQPFDADAYIEEGSYDATSSRIYGEWKKAYRGIRAANYFLENADKISDLNPTLLKQFKGEARALRAYYYIKLAGLYGSAPLVTSSIGIEAGRTLISAPAEEIWNFVEKELTEVVAWLPVAYDAANKGRVTKGAALGLLARAELYAGRYQKAADAADQVIKLGVYGLYDSYEKLFTYAAENNKEVIFDKQYLKDVCRHNVFSYLAPYSQKNGGSSVVPTKALTDSYETLDGKKITDADSGYDPAKPYVNRDTRLKFSVFLEGDALPSGITFQPRPASGTSDAIGVTYIVSTTGFNIKKYINAEDFGNPANSGINIILLRYAEILLTYAEAKIELRQIDASVLVAINQVRNGRRDVKQPSVTTVDPVALRDIVRRERKAELAFEGQRLFDIRRWRIAENVMPGPVFGITYPDNTGKLITIQVASSNRVFDPKRHYLWPIPQKERDLNPNLGQNAGW